MFFGPVVVDEYSDGDGQNSLGGLLSWRGGFKMTFQMYLVIKTFIVYNNIKLISCVLVVYDFLGIETGPLQVYYVGYKHIYSTASLLGDN